MSQLKVFISCIVIYCLIASLNASKSSGESKSSETARIVNGTNAKLGEFPYMVSVRWHNKHKCGGAILDSRHILTAGHCVYERTFDDFVVQYGVVDIGDEAASRTRNDANLIPAVHVMTHPDYKGRGEGENNGDNDLAIITLADDIKFSDIVHPTTLPQPFSSTPAGTHSIITGWGKEKTGGEHQRYLQRVDLVIYSDDECEERHGHNTSRKFHICSGVPEGGRGHCNGDSGGPLYANGAQVGVVSWSVKPCTVRGFPGVYVKLANYVTWLQDVIPTLQ